jgi:hypothetical protein
MFDVPWITWLDSRDVRHAGGRAPTVSATRGLREQKGCGSQRARPQLNRPSHFGTSNDIQGTPAAQVVRRGAGLTVRTHADR